MHVRGTAACPRARVTFPDRPLNQGRAGQSTHDISNKPTFPERPVQCYNRLPCRPIGICFEPSVRECKDFASTLAYRSAMEQEHQRAPLTVSSGADQVGEDYRDHEAEFPSSQPRRRIGTMESLSSAISAWSEGKKSSHNRWRHTLGIVLLLITVVLWTSCGFLASVSTLPIPKVPALLVELVALDEC